MSLHSPPHAALEASAEKGDDGMALDRDPKGGSSSFPCSSDRPPATPLGSSRGGSVRRNLDAELHTLQRVVESRHVVAEGEVAAGKRQKSISVDMNMIATTDDLPGYDLLRSCGVATGLTLRSRGTASGHPSSSELELWMRQSSEAREEAISRMCRDAAARGANGVVAMRCEPRELGSGVTEYVAYGTAVLAKPRTRGGSC